VCPNQWKNDDEEGGKNLHEEEFFRGQLKRAKKEGLRFSYTKVLNHQAGQDLVNNVHNLLNNDINIIVYNFVDMLSHARTEMEVLKELASDEISYRSIATSWFEHSPLNQALKKISDKKIQLILATDHGLNKAIVLLGTQAPQIKLPAAAQIDQLQLIVPRRDFDGGEQAGGEGAAGDDDGDVIAIDIGVSGAVPAGRDEHGGCDRGFQCLGS
jgi:hypothetical protein